METARMMSDRDGGLSIVGPEACSLLPSTESLLGRLDQIDLRLRQLEKQRFPPESSYFTADLPPRQCVQHLPCKSLSSALHEAHFKGSLMDRLHLLECRIRQLSYELDKDDDGIRSSEDETAWVHSVEREVKKQDAVGHSSSSKLVLGASVRNNEIIKRGARELHGQMSRMKVKDSREAINVVEKRGSNRCQDQKKRQENTRIYRKWFPVGC